LRPRARYSDNDAESLSYATTVLESNTVPRFYSGCRASKYHTSPLDEVLNQLIPSVILPDYKGMLHLHGREEILEKKDNVSNPGVRAKSAVTWQRHFS
jgi:hypothetical protein